MALGRSILDDIRYEINSGNVVMRLLFINIAVFLALHVVHVIAFLSLQNNAEADVLINKVLSYVSLPAKPIDLLYKPWTLITHMFTHYGLFHLVFNMLWLYWFGRIVEEFIGNKKILPLYLLGGLSGALLLIAAYNIFPGLQSNAPYVQALGASAGVLAIVLAAATIVPDYTVFVLFLGPVKIKWIAVVLVVIDLISIPNPNTGGHIAHLGGALLGFFYIKQLQLGNDLAAPFQAVIHFFSKIFSGKKQAKMVVRKAAVTAPPLRKHQTQAKQHQAENKEERMNAILDKISRSGYESLSKEEKDFLFKISKED
jgi:membrane associated rhomboid family serine protease